MREVGAGDRIRSVGRGIIARPFVILALVGLVAFAIWAKGTREQPHSVRVVFDEAVSLYNGLDVRVDGIDAGKIKDVQEGRDGRVVVTLGIKDDQIWPLHQGTKAALRFGSTVGNGTRIIDLYPGPASNPEISDNGIIQTKDTTEAVEFDQVFNMFDTKTRAALQGTLKGTGETFGPRPKQLRSAVVETPGGLRAIGDLAADVDSDEPALRALISNTYQVTGALAARREPLKALISNASVTFNTFANHTAGIQQSLEKFPSTSRESVTTLQRLDGSVDHLDGLITDLRPGARELGSLSRKLRPAMSNLRRTIPLAVQTFRTARRASPEIEGLLRQAQPTSGKAAPALSTFAPMASCIRPYAPEASALLTSWSSWNQQYDSKSHVGRLRSYTGPAAFDNNPLTPAQYTSATGQAYSLIRPPGQTIGQSWFQPECGVNEDGTNPAKDPEVGG